MRHAKSTILRYLVFLNLECNMAFPNTIKNIRCLRPVLLINNKIFQMRVLLGVQPFYQLTVLVLFLKRQALKIVNKQ